MQMTQALAAIAIIVSAAMHAGWNASLHALGPRAKEGTFAVLVVALALSYLALGVTWVPAAPTQEQLGWLVVSGVAEAVYFLGLGEVLYRLPLGLGYALMRGLSMLFVTALSVLFLDEAFSAIKACGMGCIGVGLILRAQVGAGASAVRPGRRRGLAAALACAVGICGYHLAYGRALAAGMAPLPLFAGSLSLALSLQVAVLRPGRAWRQLTDLASYKIRIFATGAMCLGAFLLFLLCLHHLPAGTAICLRNSSLVFAQLLAWRAGEPISSWSAASVAAVALGGCLLAYAP